MTRKWDYDLRPHLQLPVGAKLCVLLRVLVTVLTVVDARVEGREGGGGGGERVRGGQGSRREGGTVIYEKRETRYSDRGKKRLRDRETNPGGVKEGTAAQDGFMISFTSFSSCAPLDAAILNCESMCLSHGCSISCSTAYTRFNARYVM